MTRHEGKQQPFFLLSLSLSLLNSFVYCDMRKKEETNKPVKTFPNTQDNAHNRCCYCRVTTINSRRLHCIVLAVVGGKVYNFCQSKKKTISNQMKRRERGKLSSATETEANPIGTRVDRFFVSLLQET